VNADECSMQTKENVSLHGHFSLSSLFQSSSLPVAVTLLTAEDVAADSLVEHAESVRHEVTDVGQVEERQRNAEQSIDDGYDATQRRLRSNVTITYQNSNKT